MNFMGYVAKSMKSLYSDIFGGSLKSYEQIPEPVNVQDMERKQLDILLLDTSGSMTVTDYKPSRLAGAKQASIGFIERVAEFNPESTIGVVRFSSGARIVAMPVPVKDGMFALEQSINGLMTNGTTNMYDGLRLSGKVIRKSNAVSPRILLLTDGHSDYPPVAVADQLKEHGIQIDIIGIGESPTDVNEKELRVMASVVDGETRYWFIKSVGELVRKFENLAIREIK